jgi:hypothetical protein
VKRGTMTSIGENIRVWSLVCIRTPSTATTQHSTTRHKNTTQHDTTRRNATLHYTTLHNTTQNDMTWHDTTQHNTTQHNTTQHNTTQHNTTQHNTTQHNTTQHKATQHYTTLHKTTPHSISETLFHFRWHRSHWNSPEGENVFWNFVFCCDNKEMSPRDKTWINHCQNMYYSIRKYIVCIVSALLIKTMYFCVSDSFTNQ